MRPAHVDEATLPGERPREHVERLARAKAEKVAADARAPGDRRRHRGGARGSVLGKPSDDEDAVRMLLALAGGTHEVLSGIAVAGERGTFSAVGRAEVRFRAFGEEEARAYVATGEPHDKAGAYGIQGLGAALVEEIHGDYYTVVGFPIGRFLDVLRDAGWRYASGRLDPMEP